MRRPPKWNYAGIATFRIYCGAGENCNFGITLRFDSQEKGEFWCLDEVYDVYKMQHTHIVKNVGISPLVAPKIVKYVDEDPIDSENDSYGDQDMKFDDNDPLQPILEEIICNKVDIFRNSGNDSPISQEFGQTEKLLEKKLQLNHTLS